MRLSRDFLRVSNRLFEVIKVSVLFLRKFFNTLYFLFSGSFWATDMDLFDQSTCSLKKCFFSSRHLSCEHHRYSQPLTSSSRFFPFFRPMVVSISSELDSDVNSNTPEHLRRSKLTSLNFFSEILSPPHQIYVIEAV